MRICGGSYNTCCLSKQSLTQTGQKSYNCGKCRREGIMSTVSVRINEKVVQEALNTAQAVFRTVQGQLELWALVGRAALDNPDLPASFIAESIMSMAESRDDASDFVPRTRKKK